MSRTGTGERNLIVKKIDRNSCLLVCLLPFERVSVNTYQENAQVLPRCLGCVFNVLSFAHEAKLPTCEELQMNICSRSSSRKCIRSTK